MISTIVLLSSVTIAAADFVDTPLTTECWQLISGGEEEKFEKFLYTHPNVATARSADHRGASWWAWEYGNKFALSALKAYGADIATVSEDKEGNNPMSMCQEEEDVCKSWLDEAEVDSVAILERKYARDAAMKEKLDAEAAALDDEEDDNDDDEDDEDSTKITINKPKEEKKPKKSNVEKDNGDLNIEIDEDDIDDEDL